MKKLFFILIIFLLLGAGCAQVGNQTPPETKGETDIEDYLEKTDEAGNVVLDKNGDMSFSGEVLAGSSAPLLVFNQSDYEKALASDKLIVLYFYANWCPICRAEFPLMESAFNDLNTDKVVGFRVNYNDNETSENEENLARQFGVAYQHTKVFVQNGERVLKAPDSWDKTRYLDEINNFIK